MELKVKNMVCPRCIMVVRDVLQAMQIAVKSVSLGRVETENELGKDTISELGRRLREVGFELMCDHNEDTVERVKMLVMEMARRGGNESLSKELSASMGMDYKHISRLFTAHEGRTVENYYISHRIERVKELLAYDELSLKEIAYQLGYSSTAHLSRQFKQVTGVTPTQYKQQPGERKGLTEV